MSGDELVVLHVGLMMLRWLEAQVDDGDLRVLVEADINIPGLTFCRDLAFLGTRPRSFVRLSGLLQRITFADAFLLHFYPNHVFSNYRYVSDLKSL